MDTDFILKQVQHMSPSCFSVIEHQRYQAEKMLMRQFMLKKQEYQVPCYLSTNDMKAWLLAGRSFLEEFREIAQRAEARKLLMAELAWTSARRLCLNQMEQELREELEKEKHLSLQFRQKVTVEGLQMFLSVIRPKAEQDVRAFLGHLSNKLLGSFTGSHTSERSKLRLLTKLLGATAPLAAQIVAMALKCLLDEPEPLVEVEPRGSIKSGDLSLPSALRSRAKAAGTQVGTLLADTAATCFCLNASFTRARLLHVCTPVAQDMVKAIYKRFVDRSKTFRLMSFDESVITAREGVICAIQDMDDRVGSALYGRAPHQLCAGRDPMTPDECSVVAAERTATDEKVIEQRQGMRAFLSRMWRKMKLVPTKE